MIKQLFLFAALIISYCAEAGIDRRLYATVYVFNSNNDKSKAGTKTLLIFHKKHKRWAPPGGKIDPLELPDQTAVRECKEETGIDISLCGACCSSARTTAGSILPCGIEHYIGNAEDRAHGYDEREAYDFIYYAFADEQQSLRPGNGESADIRWVPVQSIIDGSFKLRNQEADWIQYFAAQIQQSLVD